MTSKVIQMLAFSALLAAASAASNAQQVYRIVGPDGKITFSDKPPAETNAKVTAAAGSPRGSVSAASLPFELRQVVQRYPVTLYTGDNCSPCQSGRSMLITRGVPFVEKSVTTPEDNEALQRLSGESSLPFATIGGQQLKGFSDVEWTQFLNAAGYPASSVLPSSYRQAVATPLVAVSAAPATIAPAAPERAAAPAPAAQPAPTAASPSGIRF
jgi:glutaredoxin